jgi:hypothetical protein
MDSQQLPAVGQGRSDSPRPSHHLTPLYRAPISDKKAGPCIWRPASSSLIHHSHSFAASASDTTFFAVLHACTLPLTTPPLPTRIPQRCVACTSISPRTLPFPSSHSPLCVPSHRRIQRLPHPKKDITSSLPQHAEEEGARQGEQEGQGTTWSCRWEASVDEEVCQKL